MRSIFFNYLDTYILRICFAIFLEGFCVRFRMLPFFNFFAFRTFIWFFSGTFCHDSISQKFHHEFSSLSNFVLQIVAFFRCMLYYHFSLAYSSFVSESCKIIDGYRPNTTETAGQIFATPRIFTDRSVTLNPF